MRHLHVCQSILSMLPILSIHFLTRLSLFLGSTWPKGSVVALHETALLPFVYLFYLSARLFAKGAFLSEKCRQIPAFVNQLSGEGADADRQYLVHFISDSAAGFIVHGVTLSQSVFLKQMHFLTAVVSGFAGVLMRRYL